MTRFATSISGGLSAVLCLVVFFAGMTSGWAQARARYKEQIDAYKKQLDKLAERDEWGVSEKARNRARQWLEDAKVLLAEGNSEGAGMAIKQVGDAIDLIKALVDRKKLETMVKDQEETYYKRKKETIPTIKKEIEQLRQRKRELKRKLEKLQNG